jgi:hypothetical protein
MRRRWPVRTGLREPQSGRAALEPIEGEWRAVATRYGKIACSFMGVLCLGAAFDWIKTSQELD